MIAWAPVTVHSSSKALWASRGSSCKNKQWSWCQNSFPLVCVSWRLGVVSCFSWGPIAALTWPPLNCLSADLGDPPWLLQVLFWSHTLRDFKFNAVCSWIKYILALLVWIIAILFYFLYSELKMHFCSWTVNRVLYKKIFCIFAADQYSLFFFFFLPLLSRCLFCCKTSVLKLRDDLFKAD